MRIQTNVPALSAQNKLAATQAALQTSTTRLSSGFRINRAADDAAGLSIANQMRGDVRALQAAQRNASQASSVLQIADGATSTIATILDRMKELATQAGSSNTTATARDAIQAEFDELVLEIDRIVDSTQFQGSAILDGSFDGTFRVGIGDTTSDGATVSVSLAQALDATTGLAIGALDLTGDATAVQTAIDAIDAAYVTVNDVIGSIGAATNRLEFASTNLSSIIQNTMAAESTIRDADMAYEMMQFSKQNILAQAGTAMLAQANQLSQSVLQLLR